MISKQLTSLSTFVFTFTIGFGLRDITLVGNLLQIGDLVVVLWGNLECFVVYFCLYIGL
jgi:hypothetical protein